MLRILCGIGLGIVTLMAVTVVLSIVLTDGPKGIDRGTEVASTELTPEIIEAARDEFNGEIHKELGLEVPEVSDETAVKSAQFAALMRQATGDLPDDAASNNVVYTGAQGADQTREVKPSYFEVWDALMAQCFALVSTNKPMDETGLTPKGEERLDYSKPYTEQTWHTDGKAFNVKAKTKRSYGGEKVLRTCTINSNRFARVDKAATDQLFGRFEEWWARERYAAATTALEYQYTLSENHQWYGGVTRFGSARGCPIKVEVSKISMGRETDMSLFMTELSKEECLLGSGSGAGGKVRVNRLPQIKP